MQQVSSAVAAEAADPTTTVHIRRIPRKLHGYFIAFTAICACTVLTGFSRTLFISLTRGMLSKPLVVHDHGAPFFAWTILLVSQALLAATGRLRMHRKLGSVAGWLVLPMLVLGSIVVTSDTVHDFKAGDGDAALAFYYGELADLTKFGLLKGGAMLLQHKPDYLKRWVLLGRLDLIGVAIGRIPDTRRPRENARQQVARLRCRDRRHLNPCAHVTQWSAASSYPHNL